MLIFIICLEKIEELNMFIIYCFYYKQSPRIYHTTLVFIRCGTNAIYCILLYYSFISKLGLLSRTLCFSQEEDVCAKDHTGCASWVLSLSPMFFISPPLSLYLVHSYPLWYILFAAWANRVHLILFFYSKKCWVSVRFAIA